jgi:hypothetical protein
MRLLRAIAMLTAAAAVLVLVVPAEAETLSVVGASTKICQLTGQTDWLTGQPTDALTQSRYGLTGIDLGFPVESDSGTLYFLFGDAVPNGHPPGSNPAVPPDDGLGKTTRTSPPDGTTCIDLRFVGSGGSPLGHPTVMPAIRQGSFNVPTGGVSVDQRIYAFFWTNHCVFPDPVGPNPGTPLSLPTPPPGSACPETPASNSLGRSVLAYAWPARPLAFTQVAPPYPVTFVPQMPHGFVYVTAAVPPRGFRVRGIDDRLGFEPIPVFGVARYRASIPYLAMAPRTTFGDFTTWLFYGGTNAGGPVWLTYRQWQSGHVGSQWAPPAGAELYADSPNAYSPSGDERCVGEHSVTWNEPLHTWLMLYSCGGWQVEARMAADPWGPWSGPTMVLSAVQNPGLFCTLFWNWLGGGGCPGLTSQQPPILSFGYFYAPFVMSRFTKNATPPGPGQAKRATIYWLLSTWDPYQVTVMRSTLALTP